MTDERLTLRQAAAALGVSESAVRKRVERGTLRSDKGPDGRRYVYLDTVADKGADTSATPERDELISELHRTNELLREVIATRDEEIRRRDTIIMNMTEAMKALNPPASETKRRNLQRSENRLRRPKRNWRGQSRGPMLQALRRAHSPAPGGAD